MPKFEAGMESMLETFEFETGDLLEKLEDLLLETEQENGITTEQINDIFRTMHTIKGSAAMMGLQNMSSLAHSVEDLFYIIRDDPDISFDKSRLYDLLFRSTDSLKNELENIRDDSIPLTDFSELMNEIHSMADEMKDAPAKTEQNINIKPTYDNLFEQDENADVITAEIVYDERCMMPSARAMVLIRGLGKLADVLKTFPDNLDDDNADDEIAEKNLFIKFTADDEQKVFEYLKKGMNVKSAEKVLKPENNAEIFPYDNLFEDNEKPDISTVKIIYDERCMMPSARAMVLIKNLKKSADVLKTFPNDLESDNADDEITEKGLFIKCITDNEDNLITLLKNGMNVKDVLKITPNAVSTKSAETETPKAKSETPAPVSQNKPAPVTHKPAEKHEQSIISVRLDRLDRLLDLVAEIVVSESAVVSCPDLKKVKGNMELFSKATRELQKLTDELQDVFMSIRMVPISMAFQKMNRVVRDMNKRLGKNCVLNLVGAETEVDKSVIDILGDPLMHIVRNAVDHGIETPEERQRLGKTEQATVTLSAACKSGEVVIECSDNGAGMDKEKILAKAKKNNLLTKPENEYTEDEIFSFVMMAGFSTNEQITEFSGRGVGMDVVKENLNKVGGKLSVKSVKGEGSVFTIKIPLSLSIVDSLLVNVGKSCIALPIMPIKEIFTCNQNDYIKDPDGNEFVMLKDKCLPIIRLSEHFNIPNDNLPLTKSMLIYIKSKGRQGAFAVDSIITDIQVVLKPFNNLLSPYDLKSKGLAGSATLADGNIALIADIDSILQKNVKEDEHG